MSRDDAHAPGALLLKLARACVREPALSGIVEPAIADLQHEVAAAGPRRGRRLLAYARGVSAFVRVMAVVPFEPVPFANRMPDGPVRVSARDPSLRGAGLLSTLLAVLLASCWPFLGWMAVAIPVCGLLLALVLHWWYVRHPADAAPAGVATRWRAAEINFASIPVGGNAGGLMAAAGSVAILVVGVPQVRPFLAGALACGLLTAAALGIWRAKHGPAGAGPWLR